MDSGDGSPRAGSFGTDSATQAVRWAPTSGRPCSVELEPLTKPLSTLARPAEVCAAPAPARGHPLRSIGMAGRRIGRGRYCVQDLTWVGRGPTTSTAPMLPASQGRTHLVAYLNGSIGALIVTPAVGSLGVVNGSDSPFFRRTPFIEFRLNGGSRWRRVALARIWTGEIAGTRRIRA